MVVPKKYLPGRNWAVSWHDDTKGQFSPDGDGMLLHFHWKN
jgi:hypothetical protein